MPFTDLSMTKLLLLGVIALVVFGPDKLPQVARDAARMLRQLRSMAQQARTELKSELGDTIGELDISDLRPRALLRKHLLDDEAGLGEPVASTSPTPAPVLASGPMDAVPFDTDAT